MGVDFLRVMPCTFNRNLILALSGLQQWRDTGGSFAVPPAMGIVVGRTRSVQKSVDHGWDFRFWGERGRKILPRIPEGIHPLLSLVKHVKIIKTQ